MKINNLEVYGIIYKITNKITKKVYVGKTKNGFEIRYGNDIYKNTHNRYLKQDIKKYGIDSFEINKELDYAFSKEELNIKEKVLYTRYSAIYRGYF